MKNYQKQQRVSRIASLAMGTVMVASGALSMALQVAAEGVTFRPIDKNIERAYGIDAFDEEYSYGGVFKYNSIKVNSSEAYSIQTSYAGTSKCLELGYDETKAASYYCNNNTSRDANNYVTTTRGAFYNNQLLDVREYLWTDKGYWVRNVNGSTIYYDATGIPEEEDKSVTIHRELHFYKTGTNTEVSFKGVISFSDFDYAEGYQIIQGYRQAYLNDPTIVDYTAPNTWTTQGGTIWVEDPYMLWVEIEGTPSLPVVLAYKAPGSRGSGTYEHSVTYIEYSLKGDVPAGVTAPKFDTVVQYGTVRPKSPVVASGADIDNYEFSGWYLDENLTEPVGNTIKIASNLKLYGEYVKKDTFAIATSITNGEITKSINEIVPGEDYTIEYSCKNGKNPTSVAIDGAYLDASKYPKEFTFEDVSGSHSISVVCETAEPTPSDSGKPTGVPNTGASGPVSFGAGFTEETDSSSVIPRIALSVAVSCLGLFFILKAVRRRSIMGFKKHSF